LPQGERLSEPFEVSDGVVVSAGEYQFVRYSMELETASKRTWSADIEGSVGGFYNGSLQSIAIDLTWRPTAMLHLSLEGERNTGQLPTGDFHEDLVAGRIRLGPSPNLDFVSFVQYDTESRSLGTNTRLRWTFHPLGDLFFVYNHNLDRPDDDWQFQNNELLVKIKYGFRY
jgi:hypothetical protein